MAYQKPKSNHPWKTGLMPGYVPRVEKKVKPVKILIRELSESWDTIEVYNYSSMNDTKHFLIDLPQSRQAAWLVGLLKRGYETI
jgi:hypothetical protein